MKDFRENIFSKTNNKSMFEYVTNNVNYENTNKCTRYTPQFISYRPSGVEKRNIDIDSMLRGMDKFLSKCTEYKYQGEKILYNKEEKEC